MVYIQIVYRLCENRNGLMEQKIQNIKIEDLVLWTENPRDPIRSDATDQEVVERAVHDDNAKWNLKKLAKEMGGYYDFSELPTVVYKEGKPIVYDGNRRIILAKIKHKLVSIEDGDLNLPEIPNIIPCNVCTEKVALNNVYRKHAESGSWDPLERDVFVNKFMGGEKTTFLAFDEATGGFIRDHKEMNQRFVRDEILTSSGLKQLGISINQDKLHSIHTEEELKTILSDLLEKISTKEISTRKRRGKVLEALDVRSRELIEKNKNNSFHPVVVSFGKKDENASEESKISSPKRTRRVASTKPLFFGGTLFLKRGDVNNLYRDICDLHEHYVSNKSSFSDSFTSLIRMSLRLLCETAASDLNLKGIVEYSNKYFKDAKKALSHDYQTLLSCQNVEQGTLVRLLNVGAHNYTTSNNYEQTIAISIILGAMLILSHGKD